MGKLIGVVAKEIENEEEKKMIVTNVGLWIDSEKPHITMDFMITPDESDEILCVKFGEDAKIISIDWES